MAITIIGVRNIITNNIYVAIMELLTKLKYISAEN